MKSTSSMEPSPAPDADGSAAVEQMLRQLPDADIAAMAALLADIGAAVAGEEDLGRILLGTLTRLGRFVPFTGGSIALVEGDELAVMAAVGPFAEEAMDQRLPRGRGRSWRIVETKEPFLSADVVAAGLHPLSGEGSNTTRSWVGVPLVRRGVGIGLLEIDSIEPGAFDDDDLRVLLTVAAALSGPIEQARLIHELQARARQQAAVATLGQMALDRPPIPALIDEALGLVARTLGHDFAAVLELDPSGSNLRMIAGVGWDLEAVGRLEVPTGPGSQAGFTLDVGGPVIVPDMSAETPFPSPEILVRLGIRSGISVPIAGSPRPFGVLTTHGRRVRHFSEDDVNFLLAVGHVLASAIDQQRGRDQDDRAAAMREAFIGVISHELRTPITTIYGSTKVLARRDSTLSEDQRREILADIEAEAERLRRIVEDLLVLSRAERGRLDVESEPVLIGHLLRRVAASEQTRWPGATFAVEASADLPATRGEETYIEQVVRNLCGNAAKYGPPRGTVRIVADTDDLGVSIRVLDDGPGIDPAEADRLFSLFYRSATTAGQAPGAGIGLFVCRQLVEAMGGRIWAKARPEGGSEFGFTLATYATDDT
ncbi:MAG TPA: GAF domain-containing protein [Candidatus Saccharimonadales bacterium]|nr:GAF domain-containing protein [Candidatus Saccharimonadales bacterium]